MAGYNAETNEENEIEHCSATISPTYDYNLPLSTVAVNRPPETKHPLYQAALARTLQEYNRNQTTAILMGDLNVTSWQKQYNEWSAQNEIWELPDPATLTFGKGAAPEAEAMALGTYLLEGLVPIDEVEDGERGLGEGPSISLTVVYIPKGIEPPQKIPVRALVVGGGGV